MYCVYFTITTLASSFSERTLRFVTGGGYLPPFVVVIANAHEPAYRHTYIDTIPSLWHKHACP